MRIQILNHSPERAAQHQQHSCMIWVRDRRERTIWSICRTRAHASSNSQNARINYIVTRLNAWYANAVHQILEGGVVGCQP